MGGGAAVRIRTRRPRPTSKASRGHAAGAAATALYSPRQMGWAALLGGFVLGVLFMHANYRALGNRSRPGARSGWVSPRRRDPVRALLSSHEAQTRARPGRGERDLRRLRRLSAGANLSQACRRRRTTKIALAGGRVDTGLHPGIASDCSSSNNSSPVASMPEELTGPSLAGVTRCATRPRRRTGRRRAAACSPCRAPTAGARPGSPSLARRFSTCVSTVRTRPTWR